MHFVVVANTGSSTNVIYYIQLSVQDTTSVSWILSVIAPNIFFFLFFVNHFKCKYIVS